MKVQDPIQEYQACKRNIRMARNAIGFLAGIMLALIMGATMGCSTSPQQPLDVWVYEGPVGNGPETRSQDLNGHDDSVVEFCQAWSVNKIYEEIKLAAKAGVDPHTITEEMVADGIKSAYDYCIRVNGRQAKVDTVTGPSRG